MFLEFEDKKTFHIFPNSTKLIWITIQNPINYQPEKSFKQETCYTFPSNISGCDCALCIFHPLKNMTPIFGFKVLTPAPQRPLVIPVVIPVRNDGTFITHGVFDVSWLGLGVLLGSDAHSSGQFISATSHDQKPLKGSFSEGTFP